MDGAGDAARYIACGFGEAALVIACKANGETCLASLSLYSPPLDTGCLTEPRCSSFRVSGPGLVSLSLLVLFIELYGFKLFFTTEPTLLPFLFASSGFGLPAFE